MSAASPASPVKLPPDQSRVVAIDGPAGSGKSTVAREVARRSGLPYLDTGAMYRAITLGVLRRGVDPADRAAVAEALPDIVLEVGPERVVVDGVVATAEIRSTPVTDSVSAVAANPAVRGALRRLQQEWIGQQGSGVLEGRDIGSVVAPDARLKVFLTASVRERAIRRAREIGASVDEVEADLERRDKIDSTRADSPLKIADDALVIDTTDHSIDAVVRQVVALIDEAGITDGGGSPAHKTGEETGEEEE